MPGCLGPSAKLPRHFFSSFRTFSKNFTTHNPKSCSPVRRGTPPSETCHRPQFQSDTSQILAAAGPISNACLKFGRR